MKTNFYTNKTLDRAAHRREDQDWLRERLAHADSRLVPVWGTQNFVTMGDDPQPALLDMAMLDALAGEPKDALLLGVAEETAYFALDISHIEEPDDLMELAAVGRFEDLRSVGPLLAPEQGSLMAYARAMVTWHQRHNFCGVCGHDTEVISAGHSRKCRNETCEAAHFPRTDPAVIMLVHDGDRIILGRNPRIPAGMYSVLAGFVEPGESLEDTVRREVLEEVGVTVEDVRYHSSQPWPFPCSLMVGFTARATSFDVQPDPAELDDAGWYSRADLRASPENESFRLPRRDSIARRLIEDWLDH
ncbi:MAG: NAD(+) diphosphatase [Alphaproteobacteria bacterium]